MDSEQRMTKLFGQEKPKIVMLVSRYFVPRTLHTSYSQCDVSCVLDGNNHGAVRENQTIKPIKMSAQDVLLYDVLTNQIFSCLYP